MRIGNVCNSGAVNLRLLFEQMIRYNPQIVPVLALHVDILIFLAGFCKKNNHFVENTVQIPLVVVQYMQCYMALHMSSAQGGCTTMAFIRVQNLVTDENGTVLRGTASVVDVIYVPGGKYHSKQQTWERLGRIISLAPDR